MKQDLKLRIERYRIEGKKMYEIAQAENISLTEVGSYIKEIEFGNEVVKNDTIEENGMSVDNMEGKSFGDYSDSVKDEVVAMRENGSTYNEISDKYGIAYHTVYSFLTKRTHKEWWEEKDGDSKVSTATRSQGLREDSRKLEALSLRGENKTYAEIADSMGLKVSVIYKFIEKKSYTEWWSTYEGVEGQQSQYVEDSREIEDVMDIAPRLDVESIMSNTGYKALTFVVAGAVVAACLYALGLF